MSYEAKKIDDDNYELFKTETMEDVSGNSVSIPVSIGTYSLANLNSLKEEMNKQVEEVDNKINAINLLQ